MATDGSDTLPHRFPCPCCGYLTSSEPGRYDICPICDWEDDLSQMRFPEMGGGANHPSLLEAQANFAAIGATDPGHQGRVRSATRGDLRDPDWRRLDPGVDLGQSIGDDHPPTYPADPTELYYWRPTFWRRRKAE